MVIYYSGDGWLSFGCAPLSGGKALHVVGVQDAEGGQRQPQSGRGQALLWRSR